MQNHVIMNIVEEKNEIGIGINCKKKRNFNNMIVLSSCLNNKHGFHCQKEAT
eukprot:m.31065 g.31065  ORF g.31065 m.31065 type:complete len:52 (+) comp6273_c2_seq1:3374-3529(+)